MSTKVPSIVHPYPPVPGAPSGVGTFIPGHPFAASSSLLTGLEHYWMLDEQSGTRNDSVGTAHLTDNNTVGYAAGKNGDAATFASANSEYLSRESTTMPDDFTVSLWCNMTSGSGAYQYACMFGCITTWSVRVQVNVYKYNNDLRAGVSPNASTLVLAQIANVFVNTSWKHIVAWYDSATRKVSVCVNNGTPNESSALAAARYSSPATMTIGGSTAYTGGYCEGSVDEVAIWSRVLTADERTTLYNAGAGKFYPTF